MFHAKETMFEPLYGRKCQKCLKNHTHNLEHNFKHMTIFFDSKYFNKINLYQIVFSAKFRAK